MVAQTVAEEWRQISGFVGLYDVSSHGRVRSYHKGDTPRLLAACDDRHGYPFVSLFRGGRGRSVKVHRLVLDAFHGHKPTDAHEADHINRQRDDNRSDNLRWVTHAENMRHKTERVGRHVSPTCEAHGSAKLTWPQVRLLRAIASRHRGLGTGLLARAWGVNPKVLYEAGRGITWKATAELEST